jgi:hypothetical protein
MNSELILILGPCGLGCVSAGVCGLCLQLSRPYRKAKSRIAILLSQLSVATSALGGLFLLGQLQVAGALGSKSAHEFAIYAYLFGFFSVGFLVIRGEVLWQRSWRPVRAISERPPVTPGAKQRFVVASAIMASSWVFAIAYLYNRTKPFAPLFVGFSSLSLFASMIFIGRISGPSKMLEIRKSIVIAAGLLICFVGAVAFRSRVTAPAQSSAWLVTVTLPCLALLSALLLLRPESD